MERFQRFHPEREKQQMKSQDYRKQEQLPPCSFRPACHPKCCLRPPGDKGTMTRSFWRMRRPSLLPIPSLQHCFSCTFSPSSAPVCHVRFAYLMSVSLPLYRRFHTRGDSTPSLLLDPKLGVQVNRTHSEHLRTLFSSS